MFCSNLFINFYLCINLLFTPIYLSFFIHLSINLLIFCSNLFFNLLFCCKTREEPGRKKITSAVWEAPASRHNGGPFKGTPMPPQYHSAVISERGYRGPLIGPYDSERIIGRYFYPMMNRIFSFAGFFFWSRN